MADKSAIGLSGGVKKMSFLGATHATAVMFCLFATVGLGQEDPAKQKAIEQVRQVAQAMKECKTVKGLSMPSSSQASACLDPQTEAGPPRNVEWNVEKSQTVRSPYQGYVEFDLVGSWVLEPLRPADKKVAKACDRNSVTNIELAKIWAQEMLRGDLGLENDVDMPESGVWHYRFEFDVGSNTPELVKMLWRDETGKLHPVTANNSCWVKAAQAVGNSRPDASTPSQGMGR